MGSTAISLARLGVKATIFFAIGADGYGDFLRRQLNDEGIDIRNVVVIPDKFTLNVICVLDRSGERHFASYPADEPASIWYPPDKNDSEIISRADWLRTSASRFGHGSTREAIIKAMKHARSMCIPVSLDLNLRHQSCNLPKSYRDKLQQAIELADYVLGSSNDELVLYTGIASPEKAAQALSDGKRTVIARSGDHGCAVITSSGATHHVPAFKVEVVNTLGAGDKYNAGFITARLDGRSIVEAARRGNAVAAPKISANSSTRRITRKDVDKLLT